MSRNVARFASVALPPLVFLLNLSLFGPQVAGWLWVGSQVEASTESLSSGLAVAFVGSVSSILATVWISRRLDHLWVLARRAVGADRSGGLMEPLLIASTFVAAVIFFSWLLLFEGTGPTLAPNLQ